MSTNQPPKKPYVHKDAESRFWLIDPFGLSFALPTAELVMRANELCAAYHQRDKLIQVILTITTTPYYWYLQDTCIGVFDTFQIAKNVLDDASDPVLIISETQDGVIEQMVPKTEIRITPDD
jgi:hypothetical protein